MGAGKPCAPRDIMVWWQRRSYGSGSLQIRSDHNGRETYYGSWRVGGRRVKRRLGVKRTPSCADGLTRVQAEAALRRLMAADAGAAGRALHGRRGGRDLHRAPRGRHGAQAHDDRRLPRLPRPAPRPVLRRPADGPHRPGSRRGVPAGQEALRASRRRRSATTSRSCTGCGRSASSASGSGATSSRWSTGRGRRASRTAGSSSSRARSSRR